MSIDPSQPKAGRTGANGAFNRRRLFPFRRPARVLIVVLLLVGVPAIAFAAWGTFRVTQESTALASVDKYSVKPQSFLVTLKEKGELKAARSVDVASEVEGRATIISIIDEGKEVKKGDLLVELASDQLDDRIAQEELKEAAAVTAYQAAKNDLDIQRDKNKSDIRKARLQVELMQLELDKYLGTSTYEMGQQSEDEGVDVDIDMLSNVAEQEASKANSEGEWARAKRDAEIAIEEAETLLERREQDFMATKELYEKDMATQLELQEDEFNFQKAKWEVEKAKMALDVLIQYTHKADLKKRISDVEEAQKELERVIKSARNEEEKKVRALEGRDKELEITTAQLAKLREQRSKCRITAPTQGFVVYYTRGGRYWDDSGQIKEGASVHERQVLMQLPDTSEMIVTARIHETKTHKVNVGQRAVVEVEGFPGRRFTGKVSKIAVLADTENRWLNPELKEYETEITLDPADAPLKPGVTAHVEIFVEEVEDEPSVPVQSIFSKNGRRYVFRSNGNDVEPVEVQVGSVGTEWAEITGGVTNGDSVLLAFGDDHTRLVPDMPAPRPQFNFRGGESAGEGGDSSAKKAGKGDGKDSHRGRRRAAAGGGHGGGTTP